MTAGCRLQAANLGGPMRTVVKPRSGCLSVLPDLTGRIHINTSFDKRKDIKHPCATEFFILLFLAVVLMGCGSGYSSNGGGHLSVVVALTTTPPVSMQTGATANVAATVSNDPASKGVTWSCTP